jgi:hypothetical protein
MPKRKNSAGLSIKTSPPLLMTPSPTPVAMSDPQFLLYLTIIVHVGIYLGVGFFGLLGIVAFLKSNGREQKYIDLFVKGEVLRILVVSSIGGAVFILAFAKILDASATASIFSGIIGYVLGGLGSKPKLREGDEGKRETPP